MENEPDTFEQCARIVEAFITGTDEETDALLTQIAEAIRDRSIDD